MKCPSCNAQLEPTRSVCPNCGHELKEGSAKRTMMGLPAMKGGEQEEDDPTKERQRSTLFGVPAATSQEPPGQGARSPQSGQAGEPAGLSESTAPAQVDEQTQSEADGATRVVSDLNLDDVLDKQPQPNQDEPKKRSKKATAFGLPSPKAGGSDKAGEPNKAAEPNKAGREGSDVASAWGLAEESSEPQSGATQVAGGELADAILQSQQGGSGFSKTKGESQEIKGTLMGMSREDFDEDSTQAVNRADLEALREQSEPADESADEFGATQAISPDKLAEFEEDASSDRRRNLLQKLRSKSNSKDQSEGNKPAGDAKRDTAKGIPAAKSQEEAPRSPSETPPSGSQPFEQPQTDQLQAKQPQSDQIRGANRPQTGPRFSIPKRGDKQGNHQGHQGNHPGNQRAGEAADAPDLDDVPVEAIEPVGEEPEQEKPGFGGGSTSFPIAAGEKSKAAPEEPDEDDLELALGDTGVLEADQSGPPGGSDPGSGSPEIREFVDDDEPAQSGGIREFSDDGGDAEPIFPIDQAAGSERRQVDLSAEFAASQAGQSPAEGQPAQQPSATADPLGSTPPSGTPVPPNSGPNPAQGQQQQRAQQAQQAQQAQMQQQTEQAPLEKDTQQSLTQPQVDPTAKFVKTVQVLFGLLGALVMMGASGYGFVGGVSGEVVEMAVMGAPAAAGLLTLIVAFLPLSGGARSGGLLVMSLAGIGALAGAIVFSAPIEILFMVLVGAVLVLCAAAFPLLLKVVQ